MKEVGIYIHIPFCKSRCYYCDFCTFAGADDIISRYIQSLKREIQERSNLKYLVKTIYIGGGTPSYIDSKFIEEILDTIRKNYNTLNNNLEITIEVNPRNM